MKGRSTFRQINGKRRKVTVFKDKNGKERVRVAGYVNRSDNKGKNYHRKMANPLF